VPGKQNKKGSNWVALHAPLKVRLPGPGLPCAFLHPQGTPRCAKSQVPNKPVVGRNGEWMSGCRNSDWLSDPSPYLELGQKLKVTSGLSDSVGSGPWKTWIYSLSQELKRSSGWSPQNIMPWWTVIILNIFWWHCSLNSGPRTNALSLEPHSQSFCLN
jgi:hypothetical protein